ncbi:Na+ ATPase [Tulasnella sp. 403]|nr:Na+ ATPase [Tulasnella sp. 403]
MARRLSQKSPLLESFTLELEGRDQLLGLSSLFQLRTIRDVRLCFRNSGMFPATDEDVGLMAESMPQLEHLTLTWSEGYQASPGAQLGTITHVGLRAISKHCRSLKTLSIALDSIGFPRLCLKPHPDLLPSLTALTLNIETDAIPNPVIFVGETFTRIPAISQVGHGDSLQPVPDKPQQSVPTLLSRPPNLLTPHQVARELNTNPEGLSDSEAAARVEQYGRNELDGGGGRGTLRIFIKQIVNAMMLVLILAMAVSFAIQSWISSGVIAAVVAINILVGFLQEYAAEKTMESLRTLSSPTATVIRASHTKVIPTPEIAPGDVVELRVGDTIPADIRLIECMNFETDEALLTGESLPVAKDANILYTEQDNVGVGDRLNLAYSSATVTKGRAKGYVVATGMSTEIGHIAQSLKGKNSRIRRPVAKPSGHIPWTAYVRAALGTVKDQVFKFLGLNVGTPLQRKLSKLALVLFGVAVLFAIVVLAANKFSNNSDVIIYAVATGLSMIPASLVVVLTITMSMGTKRMVKRHVIVRNMNALESLGAVTNICSDKTGTITQGKMVAKRAYIPAHGTFTVDDISDPSDPTVGSLLYSSISPATEAEANDIEPDKKSSVIDDIPSHLNIPAVQSFLHVASLCNLATVRQTPDGQWHCRGDPTEIGIQVFVSRFGYGRQKLMAPLPGRKVGSVSGASSPRDAEGPENDTGWQWTQLAEFPFDSDVKRMSVVFRRDSAVWGETPEKMAFMKGAVERILDLCILIRTNQGDVEFTQQRKEDVLSNMEALAAEGLRVLALASREWNEHDTEWRGYPRENIEKDMVFLGLIGLYDPPRPESYPSVKKCHRAGITVHMLTGDHKATAQAIAQQVGIIPKALYKVPPNILSAVVMTASEFDALSDDEVDALPILPLVVARCAPNTKVRMVNALHRRKCFVAMTGDGVNDSPSLKEADVGIAMGSGSDVAKGAADIVLTDDNFASILNAVEEGRRMFDNIKKFVLHVLAENIAQACTLLIGLAFKDHSGLSVFPLAPVEIVWIILITSGLPDMGLGMIAATPDVMIRPPHDRKAGVFTWEVMLDMVIYGLWMSALCLASFVLVVYGYGSGDLGNGCNNEFNDSCKTVFRARATTFTCLTWFALFLAWEMIDLRRSFFRMKPGSTKYFTQWIYDIWENRLLFWAVMAGFITIFPILYIPGLNDKVFNHKGILWEWGIVFVEAALFFAGCELWKFAKRVYIRHNKIGEWAHDPEDDLEMGAFSRYTTLAMATLEGNGGLDMATKRMPREKTKEKEAL